MDKKRGVFVGIVAICLWMAFGLAGCRRERPSQIVRTVEQAGSGDLQAAAVGSIIQWFNKHPDVAVETERLCKPVRQTALAKWPETTEGHVCNAAGQVAGFIEWRRDLETNNDRKSFQGGSK